MRQPKKIVIEIDENGDCSVEGHGFGPECKELMKEIQDNLGETTSTKEKRRKRQAVKHKNLQKGGR